MARWLIVMMASKRFVNFRLFFYGENILIASTIFHWKMVIKSVENRRSFLVGETSQSRMHVKTFELSQTLDIHVRVYLNTVRLDQSAQKSVSDDALFITFQKWFSNIFYP